MLGTWLWWEVVAVIVDGRITWLWIWCCSCWWLFWAFFCSCRSCSWYCYIWSLPTWFNIWCIVNLNNSDVLSSLINPAWYLTLLIFEMHYNHLSIALWQYLFIVIHWLLLNIAKISVLIIISGLFCLICIILLMG